MSEFQIELLFLICLFPTLLVLGTVVDIISKKRKIAERRTSSIHCHHCGSPILESDVFCENCWKITPKVQEMLDVHPKRAPEFYTKVLYRGKKRCPHCKVIYQHHEDRYVNRHHGIPIRYCTHCHQYFLEFIAYEWSVCKTFFKFSKSAERLFLSFYFSYFFFIFPESVNLQEDLFLFVKYCVISTAIYFAWHFAFIRRKQTESCIRLKRNPEYPKLLINMGYGYMMSEKYYPLCKATLIPLKDNIKNLLKDAFTFH